MTEVTSGYGLDKLGVGGKLSDNNYKFGTTDRELIDLLLRLGAETHKHDGATALTGGGAVGARTLTLTHANDAGTIPPGVRVYYRFTLVADGIESAPSDEYFVDMPEEVEAPAAPSLVAATTGGTLLPGSYYYVVTAYTGTNTQETQGLNPAFVSVPFGTATNKVTVTLPALPTGADGFNVYRKQPGGVRYDYLGSVAGAGPTFVDNGITDNDNRTIPTGNLTATQNHVTVDLVGDALPAGVSWRLYRTYALNDYLDSRIAEVTSGTTFDDVGGVGDGSLPLVGVSVNSPSQIDLTDGAEVQGTLPPSMVAYRVVLDWHNPGPVAVATALRTWRCPYDLFLIESVSVNLNAGAAPAAAAVIVDVNRYAGATPSWATIYSTQANRPTVPVGAFIGTPTVPNVTAVYLNEFLNYDVDQAGGGATPTDTGLSVQIVGWALVDEPTSVVFP